MYKINKGQTDISNPLETSKFLYMDNSYSSNATEGKGQKHKKYERKHIYEH